MGCDLIRNLDISALRSFVAVADLGGMTRAAHKLNLTQSAVSMQVKRLETAFESPLVERVGRGIALTSEGQQLLSYSRQILRLNDEAWLRLTHQAFEGQVILGVPEDLVLPIVPSIMREFAGAFPRAPCRSPMNANASSCRWWCARWMQQASPGKCPILQMTGVT